MRRRSRSPAFVPVKHEPVAVRHASRVAGLCYIVVIVLGVGQAALVSAGLPSLEEPAAVATALVDESLRFRLGVVGDVDPGAARLRGPRLCRTA